MKKLLPFQKEGVRRLIDMGGRGILADDPGLGKTLQCLRFARLTCPGETVVVVCPASLKWHWSREVEAELGRPGVVLSGRAGGKKLRPGRVYVVNYDVLDGWVKPLAAAGVGLVVVDESHMVKNARTKRFKRLRWLCRQARRVICASGTPIVNRPVELWTQLNLIRPDRWNSFFDFATTYCNPQRTPFGWRFDGAKNLKRLNREVAPVLVRRRKEDVLDQLPPVGRSVETVELDDPAEYRAAEKEFLSWLFKAFGPWRATRAAKCERMVRMGYLKRLAAQLRMQSVVRRIDAVLNRGDKLIVFGVHKAVMLPLAERYGGKAVLVNGSVVGRERQKRVDRFNHSRRCRLFLGNLQAAGTGWSCTSADLVLFAELGWTPGDHLQAEDRVRGLYRGTGAAAKARYVVGRRTIEERLLQVLQSKQAVASAVLDGGPAGGRMNVYDLLTAGYQTGRKVND